ncbi:MAG: transglutaminase domain-containing protein [Acidimicrobiia bacterium]
MQLLIDYTTVFAYTTPVWESQNVVRACPVDEPGQRRLWYRLELDPPARVASHVDVWGTWVDAFGVREPHSSLAVAARSGVETSPRPQPVEVPMSMLDDRYRIDNWMFLRPTAHTRWAGELADRAATALTGGVVESVLAIQDLVRSQVVYTPGSTHVGIDVNRVWDAGAGVCQDFAHLAIAMLRSQGIACRYVSGYLYAADPAHPDASSGPIDTQTHAWLEVLVPEWGWWAIDPTNGVEVGEHHVIIGRGRDYDDVCPMRGVYFGESEHELSAVVRMVVEQ